MQQTLAPTLTEALPSPPRAARELGLVVCAYLLLFGAAVLLFLLHSGVQIDGWVLGLCALPPLLTLALLGRDASDARRHAMHLLTAMLALPVALLFWAGSLEAQAPARPQALAPSLDAQALFRGVAAVEDADLREGGIVLLRSGRFADGSWLRLSRFGDEAAARRHLAMLNQAMPMTPFAQAGRKALRLQGDGAGSTLVLFERHGLDLLELRATDVGTALARLSSQRVPAPRDEAATALAEPGKPMASWPFFTVMALVHGLAFVALIVWAGSHTTRVAALPGAAVATPEELRARLLSLARPLGPFAISESETDGSTALRIDASPGRRRSHQITLQIDAAHRSVRVQERLGVDGDAPQDGDEASMRSLADERFDPTRPDAQRVWSSVRQATMIVPARLDAVPLLLQSRRAELPAGYAASLDGEGLLTALCALVTRSGWHWQPRLFGRRL